MKRKYRFADRAAAEVAVQAVEQVSHLRYRLLVAMQRGTLWPLCHRTAGGWSYTLSVYDQDTAAGPRYCLWAECVGQYPSVTVYDDAAELCRAVRPRLGGTLDDESLALHAICDAAQNHWYSQCGGAA